MQRITLPADATVAYEKYGGAGRGLNREEEARRRAYGLTVPAIRRLFCSEQLSLDRIQWAISTHMRKTFSGLSPVKPLLYSGASVLVNYGSERSCRIDGTVGGTIAVQVESAYSKPVRGAILDLLYHPYPQKLLILLPNNKYDCAASAYPCEQALGRFLQPERFRVVVLKGTPTERHLVEDANVVRAAVSELRFPDDSDRNGTP
jgi:hypothetical protein